MSYEIEAKDISKQYGDVTAVESVSFQVEKGEVVGIIGPNGAGKTTTMKMVTGLLEPTSGEVSVSGYSTNHPEMPYNLGFVPEASPVYDSMTAEDYLFFFADLYDVDKHVADKRIRSAFDVLNFDSRKKRLSEMSKGMTRKVVIARSLINDPDALVFDEPASGLDPYTTNHIIDFISKLAEQEKAVLFSAHNLHHVEKLCDKVVVLNDGEVVLEGDTESVLKERTPERYLMEITAPIVGATPLGEQRYLYEASSEDEVAAVEDQVNVKDGRVIEVREEMDSLEEVFLDIVDFGEGDE